MAATDTTARIRDLNDALRTAPDPISALIVNGSLVVTAALAAKGNPFLHRAVGSVRHFAAFTSDNDPHGEHDMAFLDVDGETIFFKSITTTASLSGSRRIPLTQASRGACSPSGSRRTTSHGAPHPVLPLRRDVFVLESAVWLATVDDDGRLAACNPDTEVLDHLRGLRRRVRP